jgi:hypothetical protein
VLQDNLARCRMMQSKIRISFEPVDQGTLDEEFAAASDNCCSTLPLC